MVAFSGDNPCSLAGLRVAKSGDLAISLGTSDTLFGALAEPKPSATEGHIFANPVDPDGYMAMICRKNGSLTREQVRDAVAGGKWPAFVQLLAQTPPGNNGRMGIYVREPEITPPITRTGDFRFDAAGQPTERFTAAEDVRAVLENQFLTMRLHGENVGLKPTRLIATGGASVENAILRVVADVFGAPVYVAVQADSASLGAAYRALHGWQCYQRKAFVPFAGALLKATAFRKAVDPDAAAHAAYTDLLPRLDGLEKGLMRQG
ncbi:MAG: FGGY-family carbohydrate kinase [Verrucomicrobia bacterium]|nr:FGGY-family carbohydrate kinase [Verrucomicrobiota bacterium]